MGSQAGAEVDSWLAGGGLIVASSDRAARALLADYNLRRRAQGLSAWPSPQIQSWPNFVHSAWEARSGDDRLLLNPAQEQALWSGLIGKEQHLAALLPDPRHRLAALAMDAHDLLCSYAPRFLKDGARAGWDRDSAVFGGWLTAFQKECNRNRLLSPSRAPLELIASLKSDSSPRAPLMLCGFDRILPVQREVFDAWGPWHAQAAAETAAETHFFSALDETSELGACAQWCTLQLQSNPNARILVLTQDAARRRGEIERAFLGAAPSGSAALFEFTLGVPLLQIPLARAAMLLLRWLDGSLLESEVDWLFSTGLTATSLDESHAILACMRELRRRGLARPEWPLRAFLAQHTGAAKLPEPWLRRITEAAQQLVLAGNHRQSPLHWAGLVPQLLQTLGLPNVQRLSSAEFQAWQRWQLALDTCASLGFDGRQISWRDFLSDLARVLADTLYVPESTNASIQISGPAESAGLTADAIWFLGANEDAWPAPGSAHPFIPVSVQREFGLPHATPRLDWNLAQAMTARLLASASIIHFSFARQAADADARPSRLIQQPAGAPQPLPASLLPSNPQPPLTVPFTDAGCIPFASDKVQGGSSVLTTQSQCPFKAFSTARLAAQGWEPAEFGLSASQRGLLLHAVLHSIWSGPPRGLRSLKDLLALSDRAQFVRTHVRTVFLDQMPGGIKERMPRRYLELEEMRLTRLLTEWLDYEATRCDFTVEHTEFQSAVSIAGLSLNLRLDRVDRLNNTGLAVIDYKTGDVSPKSWDLPRPDDVQLPLYAGFALAADPAGLLFAKLRPGQSCFVGRVRNASTNLLPNLTGRDSLLKAPLTPGQMSTWKDYIEQLARDFVSGIAHVDPREYPGTCERCDLQALCRIHESRLALEHSDDVAETADE